MHIYFMTLVFLYVISDFVVLLQTFNDQQKPTTKISTSDYPSTPDTWEMNPELKSLWVYRPPSVQAQQTDEQMSHRVVLRPPHFITRLAKPLSHGLNPFFHKVYFEPFERRPRPVTLVAFRKNRHITRKAVDESNHDPEEVAELQSPFNDISNFWQDEARLV